MDQAAPRLESMSRNASFEVLGRTCSVSSNFITSWIRQDGVVGGVVQC